MGHANLQSLVCGAERTHHLHTRLAPVSESIASLVRIQPGQASPDDIKSMLAELARVAMGLDDGELINVGAVVELLDQAQDACDLIGPKTTVCPDCKGSGEGRFGPVCHRCNGSCEVEA